MTATTDIFADVVGQAVPVARLRSAARRPVHAYLFLGPRGAGKRTAARAFVAALLGPDERDVRLALAGQHPDVVDFEPEGRTMRVAEVDPIIAEGSRSPIEGDRKVIVIDRFHTAEPAAAAHLLKAIEEPPPSTIYVVLAEEVPEDHVTIASRCVQIDFPAVGTDAIHDWLIGRGIDPPEAEAISAAAGGDIDRAALLASDESFVARRDAWRAIPERLDGTGATIATIVTELRAAVDGAQEPLDRRHAAELDELVDLEDRLGTRGSGRKAMTERHNREVRLLRSDELRFGFAELSRHHRDVLVSGGDVDAATAAIERLSRATDALARNVNESLLLHAVLIDLDPLAGG